MGLHLPSPEAMTENGPSLQQANETLVGSVIDRTTRYIGYAASLQHDPALQYSAMHFEPDSAAWLDVSPDQQRLCGALRQYYTADWQRHTNEWDVSVCLVDTVGLHDNGKYKGRVYLSHNAHLTVSHSTVTIHNIGTSWETRKKDIEIDPDITLAGLVRATEALLDMQRRASELPRPKSFFITA